MTEIHLSAHDIAKMIDISAVQTPHGEQEIRQMIELTAKHGFGCVHVLPAWVSFTKPLMSDAPHAALGAPVGFPSGGNHTEIKKAEAIQLIKDGVDELDMMLNVGKLRSGDDKYVIQDIQAVVNSVDVPIKVILETHYLTEDEIRRACSLAIGAGAAFIKTSTGWAETGATVENVELISSIVNGQVGIKAAGGIRTIETLVAMYKFGVRRFGINQLAAVDIIESIKQLPGQIVRVAS